MEQIFSLLFMVSKVDSILGFFFFLLVILALEALKELHIKGIILPFCVKSGFSVHSACPHLAWLFPFWFPSKLAGLLPKTMVRSFLFLMQKGVNELVVFSVSLRLCRKLCSLP